MSAPDSVAQVIAAFVAGKTSAAPVVRAIRMQMRKGCGDHSCEFRKPSGMGTNGGCRCWNVLDSAFAQMSLAALERAREQAEKGSK